MSERFKNNEVGCIVDYQNGLKNYDGQEIVDLMNELDDEIIALKHTVKFLGQFLVSQGFVVDDINQFVVNKVKKQQEEEGDD